MSATRDSLPADVQRAATETQAAAAHLLANALSVAYAAGKRDGAREEREECARLCFTPALEQPLGSMARAELLRASAAIRARGAAGGGQDEPGREVGA